MLSTESHSNTPAEPPSRAETIRRKVRRGTHSCWECKRRKVKCSYASPSDARCIGCRRRSTTCLGQHEVDERAAMTSAVVDEDQRMGDRMVRVEALIERLADQVVGGQSKNLFPINDSESEETTSCSPQDTQSPRQIPSQAVTNNSLSGKDNASISTALYAALPPRQEIDLIIKAGLDVSLHRLMTTSLATLSQSADGFKAGLADVPNADTHPTLLARYLLILATCLQSAHPEFHANEIRRLSEPPQELMRRVADKATDLLTSKDEFLGSVEGLECAMLESMYLANSGNLRRAWLVCRRAMVVAQLFGLHRADCQQLPYLTASGQMVNPGFFWFRIVCTDRQLSLMLGLPQGTTDVSMATEAALANSSLSERFERKQCFIASRILARNECGREFIDNEFAAVLSLDAELQQAANEIPSKWWLVPNLASYSESQEHIFWEMLRLIDQMLYFNLLNLLHLPSMLRSRGSRTEQASDNEDLRYSKLASINASRELLARYIMLRSHNRVASSCRSVDFFAITAAMTLVISHLDEHSKQRRLQHEIGISRTNMLAHQRNGDRAMMEKVLESMEAVARLSTDFLSNRSAGLLRRLLALEMDAAGGKSDAPNSAAAYFLQLDIPYFGAIRISSEGDVVSMDNTRSNTIHEKDCHGKEGAQQKLPDHIETASPIPAHIPPTSASTVKYPESSSMHQSCDVQDPTAMVHAFDQQFSTPIMVSNPDEWMLDGTDTVFFDNLMGGSGSDFTWVNYN